MVALLGGFKVAVNDADTLTISSMAGARRFAEVEPLVYREVDGPRKVVFQEDQQGNVTSMFFADAPAVAAARRPWYKLQDVHLGLLSGCSLLFASALFFWPALGFTVRGGGSPKIKRNWRSGMLSGLAWLLSIVSLGFLVGVGYVLIDPNEIVFGLTPTFKILLAVTQVAAVLAALTVLGCLIAWKNGYWRLSGRVHYTLVALAGVGFIALLYFWNLLTFGFRDLL
jgi:hypothetical protein